MNQTNEPIECPCRVYMPEGTHYADCPNAPSNAAKSVELLKQFRDHIDQRISELEGMCCTHCPKGPQGQNHKHGDGNCACNCEFPVPEVPALDLEAIEAAYKSATSEGEIYASYLNQRALIAEVRRLEVEVERLKRWQMEVEEREAAVCPEDVGFDKYIRHLKSQLDAPESEKEQQ